MTPFGYSGIDFGTSNSYFAYCNSEGDSKPQTICLAGRGASQITCVLWRLPATDDSQIAEYGTTALQTWLDFTAEERSQHRLAFGFKPDLVKSAAARQDARAFLLKACADIRHANLPRKIEPGGMAVVIGVPAEIGAEHKRLTTAAAREAGFGDVECVEEPLGALAFHLNSGDITPVEARAGVVVVDFGGGTLDVALVNADGLREPWGDPMLGGRLFDDLFYQWLADQNRPLEVDDREAMALWQNSCRELKENFSNRWRAKGDDMSDFKAGVMVGDSRKKWLKNASVKEFQDRARSYRPSRIARRYFQGLDSIPNGLVDTSPIDLFDWIRRTLTRGQAAGSLRGQFSKVILTGGSSHWPFMSGLVAAAFGVDAEHDILLSQSPETTIGSGLALYNVLKLKNEARRIGLKSRVPPALEQFHAAITERLDRFADAAAEALLAVLMPRVEAVFWRWYRCGGSLRRVEGEIGEICDAFQESQEGDHLLQPFWEALETDLVRLLRDHLKQFLAENEIARDVSRYVPEGSTLGELKVGTGVSDDIAQEFGELAEALTELTAAIGAIVIAAIKIKVVLLVAIAHPVLAVAVGIGALMATLGLGNAVGEAAQNAIRNHEFNDFTLMLLKAVLWESSFREKLASGREQAKAELRQKIRESTQGAPVAADGVDGSAADETPPRPALEELVVAKFGAMIDLVIRDLDVLEMIRSKKA